MHEQLLTLMARQAGLSDGDKALCEHYFEPVQFPRSQVIEPAGSIPRYLYFVAEGFLRLFHYDREGAEVTTHLNCPPGFITSYAHFISQTVSHETLECITPCRLLRITKDHLDALTSQSSACKDFSIWVFQQSLSYNENRARELAALTAEQRYAALLGQYPGIVQNVPLRYIASFLGMNPKSLSRIRRQFIR